VIKRFVEKPRPGETDSHAINAGLYALSSEVLRLIPSGKAVSIEREIFPSLLKNGMPAYAYSAEARPYWNDIGTPPAYLRANLDILQGRLKLGKLFKGLRGESVVAKGVLIARMPWSAAASFWKAARSGRRQG